MSESLRVDVVVAPGPDLAAVRSLWREYWDSLGFSREFQSFAKELRTLPGVYGPPGGRLLLARIEGNAAGAAGLRPLSTRSCEAKHLYLRPQYRGVGIGKLLLGRLAQEARAGHYHEMYGDTLKAMASALQMYSEFGFRVVDAYSSNPTPDAIFLKLSLSDLSDS